MRPVGRLPHRIHRKVPFPLLYRPPLGQTSLWPKLHLGHKELESCVSFHICRPVSPEVRAPPEDSSHLDAQNEGLCRKDEETGDDADRGSGLELHLVLVSVGIYGGRGARRIQRWAPLARCAPVP